MITKHIVTREAVYAVLEYGVDFSKADTIPIQGKQKRGRKLSRAALESICDRLGFDGFEGIPTTSTDKEPNIQVVLIRERCEEGDDPYAH